MKVIPRSINQRAQYQGLDSFYSAGYAIIRPQDYRNTAIFADKPSTPW